MSRNRYDDAFGVVRIKWGRGRPSESDGRPVLCEVWRSSLDVNWSEATKPHISVMATVEIRVRESGKWWVIGFEGEKREAKEGEVRRHAHFDSRSWHQTVTLDGWGPQ